MVNLVRYLALLISAIQVGFAIAFFFQWPLAVRLWPFPGTTPLTYIFISSIFAAAAASTIWVAISKNYGAFAGIGLDYIAILLPASVYSFTLGTTSGNPHLTSYGVACALGVLFGSGLFLWSLRFPLDRTSSMPLVVRWSFVGFVVALVTVSTLLILQVPNVIPWRITPEISVVIGMYFAGAAVYFSYGVINPRWPNAAAPLAGFLAYDLVLIVPFLTRLPMVPPEHKLSLVIYTAVVVYSGALAIYYLFLHRTNLQRGGARLNIPA